MYSLILLITILWGFYIAGRNKQRKQKGRLLAPRNTRLKY